MGAVVNGRVRLHQLGNFLAGPEDRTGKPRGHVHSNERVVMPERLHGSIVIIEDCRGRSSTGGAATDKGVPRRLVRRQPG